MLRTKKILLVEDDPGHTRLIEKNLRRAGIANDIVFFDNGQSLLDYLSTPVCEQGTQECLLMLLDLNLPVFDGYQVLQRIKADQRTKKIPIIVLTTTDIPQDVERCYDLGCNLFITKPIQYEEFSTAIRNLGLLLSVVKIPSAQ
ncbi:MAG TPA: response regulator [Methylomusa anaerophila]|uniref:Response regulator rcp1 n=1 Tax=Methylomusa anaerophila TaxID=1930071 RepID=A0A348ALS6_9FIRM|nr:response regulator [Methylomusa anaerophila]BBB92024.1 response regulator rcp1 [Methylomusa anaerophila]HML87965.1 response regulator [Methylomusa anaerophila]